MIKRLAKKMGIHRVPFFVKIFHKLLKKVHNLPDEDGVICDIALGLKIKNWNPSTSSLARAIYLDGIFEPKVTNFFLDNIKEGMTAVDVGADNGYYTIIFSRLVGEKGNVLSFEPIEYTCKRTAENIELNGLKNVSLNNMALGNQNGTVRIMEIGSDSTLEASGENDHSGSVETKIQKFDDFLKENPRERIDFIQIDCEGAEMDILRGMNETLAKYSPQIVVEIHEDKLNYLGSSVDELLKYMEQNGYSHNLLDKERKGYYEGYPIHFFKPAG